MLQREQEGNQTLLMASKHHHSSHIHFIGTKPLNPAHSQRDECRAPSIGGKHVNKFMSFKKNSPLCFPNTGTSTLGSRWKETQHVIMRNKQTLHNWMRIKMIEFALACTQGLSNKEHWDAHRYCHSWLMTRKSLYPTFHLLRGVCKDSKTRPTTVS